MLSSSRASERVSHSTVLGNIVAFTIAAPMASSPDYEDKTKAFLLRICIFLFSALECKPPFLT